MALTTAEVTAVSRNSGTRRIREDTQGHDQGANQVQEDTGGPAGILKDTSPRRFGTLRPRVQIPGPRPTPYARVERNALTFVVSGSSSSCLYRDDSTAISAILPATLL